MRTKIVTLCFAFSLFGFSFIYAQQTTEKDGKPSVLHTPLSKEDAHTVLEKIQNKDAILVDVRTPEEYNEGHLKFSTNIDVNADDFKSQISKLDKSKTIYLYCLSGNRSAKASDILKTLGFKAAFSIGGFEDLKVAGLPVQK